MGTSRRGSACPVAWRTFGRVDVLPLIDGQGIFFESIAHAFPGARAADRRRAAAFDCTSSTDIGTWRLQFRCYAVRLPDGRMFLVDAGIGPSDAPAAHWAPVPGQLPDLLSPVGVDPADIDAVVLTHLHSDHVGWAVVNTLPYFPNARYVIQQSEILSALDSKTRQVVLEPLQRAHRLEVIDGATRLASGVTVIHTPGHTPGHQSVLIRSQDIELVLAGDVLVHPLQLVNPSLEYSHESDPAAARETRQRLLTHAARHGTAIGTAHLTPPFVDLSSLASLHQ